MVAGLSAARLARDTRGAAYVEFLIAFLPILVLFMCIWQLGRIFTTRVLCTHAAIAGARAAAVVVAEPEDNGLVVHQVTDDKKQQITIAVYAALAPVLANDWLSSIEVTFPPTRGGGGSVDLTPNAKNFSLSPPAMLHVRVSARYRCRLPFADLLMCDRGQDSGWTFPITAEGSFPYQSARYAYDPPSPQKPTDYDSSTPHTK
jgi:Flp pilus assembly protein TadG